MPVDALLYSYVASEETYEDKDTIIEEGQKGDWVYVILEGKARVVIKTEKGGAVTIENMKEGDIFGEMVFFSFGKQYRTANILADGPLRVGILDSTMLLSDYECISPRLRTLLKSLVIRLQDATKKVVSLATEGK